MATIYGELHQNIQDTFNEAGVEILSPTRCSCVTATKRYLPLSAGYPFADNRPSGRSVALFPTDVPQQQPAD